MHFKIQVQYNLLQSSHIDSSGRNARKAMYTTQKLNEFSTVGISFYPTLDHLKKIENCQKHDCESCSTGFSYQKYTCRPKGGLKHYYFYSELNNRNLTLHLYKQTVPLVISFHPDLPNLTRILHNHQCIIHTSPRLKEAIPNTPS